MTEITQEYLASQGFNETFLGRFFGGIHITPCCWIWTKGVSTGGYGRITRNNDGDMIFAHRASWIIFVGPIPDGMCVCHDCPDGDNPTCVNPAHLWLGTRGDNFRDCIAKGRMRWSDQRGAAGHGAKLTQAQVEEIRVLYRPYDSHGRSAPALAKRFGVAYTTVWSIVNRKSWTA